MLRSSLKLTTTCSFGQKNDITDSPSVKAHVRQSSGSNSIFDGISRNVVGAGTALVERLQAQVKQKDGEIEVLQVKQVYNANQLLEKQVYETILCDKVQLLVK